MGACSNLIVGNYPVLCESKSYNSDIVKMLFQIEDLIISDWDEDDEEIYPLIKKQDKEDDFIIIFRQTVKVCLNRLRIYGYSYQKSKNDFDKVKSDWKNSNNAFSMKNWSYKKYLYEIKNIIDDGCYHDPMTTYSSFRDYLSENLILFDQSYSGFLYSIFSVLPDDTIVEYDLTDVIAERWVDIHDVIKINTEKIIVLTEGKTDAEFISQSIKSYILIYGLISTL